MSESNGDQLDALVRRPVKGIAVELKTWIDARTPDDIAKLVKSAFALRNRDGGYIVIGFDDKTRLPDPYSFSDRSTPCFTPTSCRACFRAMQASTSPSR